MKQSRDRYSDTQRPRDPVARRLEIGQDHSDRIQCVQSNLYDVPIPIPRHKLVFRTLVRGKQALHVYARASQQLSTRIGTRGDARVYRRSNRSPTTSRTPCYYPWLNFSTTLPLQVDPSRSRMSLIPKEDTTGKRDRSRGNDRDVDLWIYSKIPVPFDAIFVDWISFFSYVTREVSILYKSLEEEFRLLD